MFALAALAGSLMVANTQQPAYAADDDVALPVPGSMTFANWTVGAVDHNGAPLAIPVWHSLGDDAVVAYSEPNRSRLLLFVPGPGPYNDPLLSQTFTEARQDCSQRTPSFVTTAGGINVDSVDMNECWLFPFRSVNGDGPSGVVVPMTTIGSSGEELVFDRWQSTAWVEGPCQSGDIGYESYLSDDGTRGRGWGLSLGGTFSPSFKSWVFAAGGAVPGSFTVAAHYVPLQPDITAPRVAITTPSGCGIATDSLSNVTPYAMNSTVLANYGCQDPGRGVPLVCDGTVPNGEPIDTSSEGVKSFTVTSTDDEGNMASRTVDYVVGPATPEVSVNDIEVDEAGGDKDVTFTVSLSYASGQTVTVDYAMESDTAVADRDFDDTSGTLTFAPGQTEAEVTVRVTDDDVWEPTVESASLVVTGPFNEARGLLSITSDDDEPEFVSLAGSAVLEGDSGVTQMPVTATISNPSYQDRFLFTVQPFGGSAVAGIDYEGPWGLNEKLCVVPAGATSCTVFVSIFGDTEVEEDETIGFTGCRFTLELGCESFPGSPGTILNDDYDETIAPTITAEATTQPNAAGWYRGPVTIHFTCADEIGGSGIAEGACPDDEVLTVSGTSTARTVMDRADNVSEPSNTISVLIDDVVPTIGASVDREPNAAGWYRSAVFVDFACDDEGGSGLDFCTAPITIREGVAQTVVGTATDVADNESSAEISGLNVDETAPVVQWNGGPAAGATYTIDDLPDAPTCEALDDLSGADTCVVTGYSIDEGDHIMTATATDLAGNTATSTRAYSIGAVTDLVPESGTVSTTVIAQGGDVVVTGAGFEAEEAIEVWLNSTPVRLATGSADAQGNFVRTVTIPSTAEVGAHRIEIRGAESGSVFIDVTIVAAAGEGSGLAATGAVATAQVALVTAALLLFGLLLVVARSAVRRSTRMS